MGHYDKWLLPGGHTVDRRSKAARQWKAAKAAPGLPRRVQRDSTGLYVSYEGGKFRPDTETLWHEGDQVELMVGGPYAIGVNGRAFVALKPRVVQLAGTEEDRPTEAWFVAQPLTVEGCVKCENEGAGHDGEHVLAGME